MRDGYEYNRIVSDFIFSSYTHVGNLPIRANVLISIIINTETTFGWFFNA